MDVMVFAGKICFSDLANEIHGVYGPFTADGSTSARIWLKNGYGISILLRPFHNRPELMTIRRTMHFPKSGEEPSYDFGSPTFEDVISNATVEDITRILAKLSEMPEVK